MDMPNTLPCPACSNTVTFASAHTQLSQCGHCTATVHRRFDGTVITDKIGGMRYHNSQLQPGTTGQWQGKPFIVLGGFLAWFQQQAFHYWTVQFADDTIALLAEGYGFYLVLEETNWHALPSLISARPKINHKLPFNGQQYYLQHKGEIEVLEVEGECWLRYSDHPVTVLDYSSNKGHMLTVFSFGKGRYRNFITTETSFDELSLNNLRAVEALPEKFHCTSCNHLLQVHHFPFRQTCSCTKCNTWHCYNLVSGWKRMANGGTRSVPLLPIGSTGTLNNVPYTVVGYAQKQEKNVYQSRWREYTLYNSHHGYACLSEYDGHWILVKEQITTPVLTRNTSHFWYNSTEFRLYNRYHYKILDAVGEFAGNAFDVIDIKCHEFINPPEMWIWEEDPNNGNTWFFARHVPPKVVASAFDVAVSYPIGIGAIEPVGMSVKQVFLGGLVGFAILLAVHLLTTSFTADRVVYQNSFSFPDSGSVVTVVTPTFTLDKRKSNMEIGVYANVDNSWFALEATLVNVQTGDEYSLEQGVEYYYGYEDGEKWSEGNLREEAYFTGIPAGNYRLQLQGTKNNYDTSLREFDVTATYDVASTRNLWWCVLLFILYPAIQYAIVYYKERGRWSNSPFTPYEQ